MPDYSDWQERKLAPAALLLDADNPRIPPLRAPLSQRELIAELVAHDDVYELARDIADVGFDPVESMIGCDDDGKTIVLEGNRRLAALKLLQDPTLSPEAHLSRFKKLGASPTLDLPARVRVLLAPTRDAAAPLILRKHTREQVARWSPLQQARFYRRLLEAGESPEQIAGRSNVTAGDVRDFLRMDAMYEIAQAIEIPEDVREIVHDPRRFPASVLRRLLEVPSFRDFLQLQFDNRGRVSAKAKPKAFRDAYRRVLTEIANKTVDTRKLNRADDVDAYVGHLAAVAPPEQKRAYSMSDLMGSPPPASQPAVADPAPQRTARSKSKNLIPSTIRCTLDDPRVKEIFRELKKLNPKPGAFPNAHAVLLRLLLEFGVAHYLTETGLIKPLLQRVKDKKKGKDWSPTLTQMLRELLSAPDLTLSPNARKAITRLVNDNQQSMLSVTTMDQFLHNEFEWPNDREIARLWKLMEPVLVLVLREPSSPSGAASK